MTRRVITADIVRADLPKIVRKHRARIMAVLLTEGHTVEAARPICERRLRQNHRIRLRNFADEYPHLETTARHVLRQQGVL